MRYLRNYSKFMKDKRVNEEIEIFAPEEQRVDVKQKDTRFASPEEQEVGGEYDEMDQDVRLAAPQDYEDVGQPNPPGVAVGTTSNTRLNWSTTSRNREGLPLAGNESGMDVVFRTTVGDYKKNLGKKDPLSCWKPVIKNNQYVRTNVDMFRVKDAAGNPINQDGQLLEVTDNISDTEAHSLFFNLGGLPDDAILEARGNGLLAAARASNGCTGANINLQFLLISMGQDQNDPNSRSSGYVDLNYSGLEKKIQIGLNTAPIFMRAAAYTPGDVIKQNNTGELEVAPWKITAPENDAISFFHRFGKNNKKLIDLINNTRTTQGEFEIQLQACMRDITVGFLPDGELTQQQVIDLYKKGEFKSVDAQVIKDVIDFYWSKRTDPKYKPTGDRVNWDKQNNWISNLALPAELKSRFINAVRKTTNENFRSYVKMKTGFDNARYLDAAMKDFDQTYSDEWIMDDADVVQINLGYKWQDQKVDVETGTQKGTDVYREGRAKTTTPAPAPGATTPAPGPATPIPPKKN